MSPRRSSRARIPQSQTVGVSHGSTSSSNSSGRLNRAGARSDSRNKSLTPPSLSEDDMDGPESGSRQTRQKRRDPTVQETTELELEPVANAEEEADEEEITRCLCRRQEYPGPPVPLPENVRTTRDNQSVSSLGGLESLPDDAGSLFIQCDTCKVWQHGGCVGIMDEASSPENYFCEECRTDLHKIMLGARGQRYSRYLPVYEATHPKSVRKHSITKDSVSRSSRDIDLKNAPIGSAAYAAAKRRSTMNSRAMWEEEEELQRVLEASKTEGTPDPTSGRKAKRSREDSDETKQDLKRRKTGSDSESPSHVPLGSQAQDSENEGSRSRSNNNGALKRMRSGASLTQRERDAADREKERERERAEAAGRRKGRAERRHADEPEPSDEVTRPSTTMKSAPTLSRAAKPPIGAKPASTTTSTSGTSASHKKNGRPPNRRGGRLGRNQYTKDRDGGGEGKHESPAAFQARDGEESAHDYHGAVGMLTNGSKPSKPRHMNPNRTSMNDLRKRAAGILEYISRTQVEMAAEQQTTPPSGTPAPATPIAPPGSLRVAPTNGSSKLNQQVEGRGEVAVGRKLGGVEEVSFKQLSSLQMMDVLTREIVLWQKEHGKWGER